MDVDRPVKSTLKYFVSDGKGYLNFLRSLNQKALKIEQFRSGALCRKQKSTKLVTVAALMMLFVPTIC